VQNRVAIAQPRIPADVSQYRGSPRPRALSRTWMMVVHLYSPDKVARTPLFISNYATVQITDMLNRIYGRSAPSPCSGARDYSMRSLARPGTGCTQLGSPRGDVRPRPYKGQNVQVASGVPQPSRPVAQPRRIPK